MTTEEKPEQTSSAPAVEMSFQAEVQQVLALVINSLYAHKEVFLRELISNASDALDRGRFLSLTSEDVTTPEELAIDIALDEEKHTLTIEDSGIGMTRDEIVKNLGTIARSGSLEFLKANAEVAKSKDRALEIIGQFGVGFYAAFMVAQRIDVESLSMVKGSEPVLWRSSGAGTFTVAKGERDKPGTRIVLHLKDDAHDFAKSWRVTEIIKKYSDFVTFPIRVNGEAANQSKALWTLPKSQVTDEQYTELYRTLSGHAEETPLTRVHVSIDAPVQFHALLYVPAKAPLDLFHRERRGLRLYAKRVLIMEECDKLTPIYLRFLRGVVDSEDLSLNVSREMLQEDKALSQIESQITKQVLKALKELAEERPDDYKVFWRELGRVLKEGISLDWKNKDAIADLCRFESLNHPAGELISLKDYVTAMPEAQKDIYYVTGLGRKAVESSPHLEAFRKKGYDVLFFTDAVDEWVAQGLWEYDKRKLKSVTHGDIDLGESKEEEAQKEEDISKAVEAVKGALTDVVKDVRVSKRLTDSASCLVADEGDPGANMERIMRMMDGNTQERKRILELNPSHAFVKNLSHLAEKDPSSDTVREYAGLLYDQALLAEGVVNDPAKLSKKLGDLLADVSSRLL